MIDTITRERFFQKIRKSRDNDCWIWIGSNTDSEPPRGQMKVGGKRKWLAHRLSYVLHVGEIPKEQQLKNTCGKSLCVNPKHLYLAHKKKGNR